MLVRYMKKRRQLAPFSLSKLCVTNFYKFYGRFKDIGLLEVEYVFEWQQHFGLDAPLGIDENVSLLSEFTPILY